MTPVPSPNDAPALTICAPTPCVIEIAATAPTSTSLHTHPSTQCIRLRGSGNCGSLRHVWGARRESICCRMASKSPTFLLFPCARARGAFPGMGAMERGSARCLGLVSGKIGVSTFVKSAPLAMSGTLVSDLAPLPSSKFANLRGRIAPPLQFNEDRGEITHCEDNRGGCRNAEHEVTKRMNAQLRSDIVYTDSVCRNTILDLV